MSCKDLFSHSLSDRNMETIEVNKDVIKRRCSVCGYEEVLSYSNRQTLFVNDSLMSTKKWAADDNKKELLQPLKANGDVNEEFTQAYGYNPFDERTALATPAVQRGGK